jgi:hypothetical protein
LTSTEEIPQNEQRELTVNKEEQDRVNCLGEVSLLEELKEAKTSLEALMQDCAESEQQPQNNRGLDPDALILPLIVRGLCHRICRKDLFCPYAKCKAGIKNSSALLTHLTKKHELVDVWCKDLMPHFIHGLSPRRIDIVLKTRHGVTVNKLWDMEMCPCLVCDCFYNRHHNVEVHGKAHKEMRANMEALGSF